MSPPQYTFQANSNYSNTSSQHSISLIKRATLIQYPNYQLFKGNMQQLYTLARLADTSKTSWRPSWPRVHKAFQNQDQDQAQVKLPLLWTFFDTYYNYLTIDCWYLILIKDVLQTGLLGILSFFYERKSKLYSCRDRFENLSPRNNRINFIKVNCLQHVL